MSEGIGELFDMQMNRPAPPLGQKVRSVNPALAEAIQRMLEKDPADGFQTMGEIERALLAVARHRRSGGRARRVAQAIVDDREAAGRSDPPASRTCRTRTARRRYRRAPPRWRR